MPAHKQTVPPSTITTIYNSSISNQLLSAAFGDEKNCITMAESQRKVELQEADDLRYLINNVRRAANTKIDLALPPIEGEDALRSKVEELVHGVSPPPSFPTFYHHILIAQSTSTKHSPSPPQISS